LPTLSNGFERHGDEHGQQNWAWKLQRTNLRTRQHKFLLDGRWDSVHPPISRQRSSTL
jgi:hypothetical protein